MPVRTSFHPTSASRSAHPQCPAVFLYVPHILRAHRLLAHKWRLMWASKHGHMSKDPELKEWQRNYYMNPINTFSLFDEFMEMSVWRSVGWADGVGVQGKEWVAGLDTQ